MSRDWWAGEPVPVRAVIDLANVADNDAMVAAFVPGHEDAVEDIAVKLAWINRCETDAGADVLADWHGYRLSRLDPERDADVLAGELRADVRCIAQLVASLHVIGRAAA